MPIVKHKEAILSGITEILREKSKSFNLGIVLFELVLFMAEKLKNMNNVSVKRAYKM